MPDTQPITITFHVPDDALVLASLLRQVANDISKAAAAALEAPTAPPANTTPPPGPAKVPATQLQLPMKPRAKRKVNASRGYQPQHPATVLLVSMMEHTINKATLGRTTKNNFVRVLDHLLTTYGITPFTTTAALEASRMDLPATLVRHVFDALHTAGILQWTDTKGYRQRYLNLMPTLGGAQ